MIESESLFRHGMRLNQEQSKIIIDKNKHVSYPISVDLGKADAQGAVVFAS